MALARLMLDALQFYAFLANIAIEASLQSRTRL
jgi:hypothetical protein